MKNADYKMAPFVHLYVAVRRRKDNPNGAREICYRELIQDPEIDLERLKCRIKTQPGIWRIHKTVNKRDTSKAFKLLQHRMIEEPEIAMRLPTIWKTCLLQTECRAERNILLDIDSPASHLPVVNALMAHSIVPLFSVNTPSGGSHVVCPKFDTRIIEGIEAVTVMRDDVHFVERLEVLEFNDFKNWE